MQSKSMLSQHPARLQASAGHLLHIEHSFAGYPHPACPPPPPSPPQPGLRRHRRHPPTTCTTSASSFSASQAAFNENGWQPGGVPPRPAGDGGLFGLLQTCYDLGCGITANIVSWGADLFLGSPLAPYDANRAAVENSIRTALALGGLALLQRAIPLILNIGCIGLGLYVFTHVYNVRVPIPGERDERVRKRGRRYPRHQHASAAAAAAAAGNAQGPGTAQWQQAYRAPGAAGPAGTQNGQPHTQHQQQQPPPGQQQQQQQQQQYYQQQQQQQRQQWQQGGARPPGGGTGAASSRGGRGRSSEPLNGPFRGSKDLVDVYFD